MKNITTSVCSIAFRALSLLAIGLISAFPSSVFAQTCTYIDNFDAVSYSGTNGTEDWSAMPWMEVGDMNGPTGTASCFASGFTISVASSGTCQFANCFDGSCLVLSTITDGLNDFVSRQFDLTGATSASLSFRQSVDLLGADEAILQARSGGGAWTTLATYNASNFSGMLQTYPLTPFIAADTEIRFQITGNNGGFITVDNLEVSYDCGPTTPDYIMGTGAAANNATINTCEGTFYDSGGPSSNYGFDENLAVTFCADNGGQIVFDFTQFVVERDGPTGCFDELFIYDGTSTSGTLLFSGCNNAMGPLPPQIESTNGCLHVVFQSDDITNRPGWAIDISCTPPVVAGDADYTIDEGGTETVCSGIFADSGDTNGDYGNSESESMTFCSDMNNQVSFTFEHFNLAAGDVLEIFDGNTTGATSLGTFTGFGEANSPGVITSSGTCLTFEFTSDGSGTSAGWEASIKCTGTPDPAAAGGGWMGYPGGSACGGNEEIAGAVFEDIDQDGQRDTGEPILPGVSVSLYDDGGLVAGPVNTDANGEYSFTGLMAGTVYRVEFGTLAGLSEGPHGTGSSTAVQFVDAGSCDVDFGMVDPSHYCNAETNPLFIVPCYVNGDPQDPSNVNESGVVSFDYNASGDSPHASYTNIVTAGTVGSTWGVAHSPVSNTSYFGTVLKRHVGIGPGGIGAIYSHQESDANTVAPIFYDFGAGAGIVASNAVRFPGGGSMFGEEGPCGGCDNVDPTTFGQVGKVGLGDIEIDPQNEFIYATNLADRKVYKISADNPAAGSATPLPGMPWLDNSICSNGIARPWALEFRRGKLYVGVVCDASSSPCDIAAACSDLTATVFSFDGSSWTTELSFPLDYYRDAWATGSSYFVKWIDDWNVMAPFVANVTDGQFGQPIVMDIEFDDDNSIILGIGDRSGLQMGYQAPNPTAGPDDRAELNFAFGDILRASYDAGADTYTLENDGMVGGLTGTNPSGSSGPGGRSFYWGDYFTGVGAGEYQSGLGPLALLPCSGEVMFPVADAVDYYSNGIVWFNNTTGGDNRRMEVYQGSASGDANNFSKGVGLGDLGFIREDPANIEIGNIVWWDENANGLQDPSEAGIPNVALQLWKDDGMGNFSQVASTTTDAFGRYIFSSSTRNNGLNAEDWTFTADDAVMINTNYEVRIASWATEAAIALYRDGLGYTAHLISTANNQGASGMQRDNDGVDNAGTAVASLTTGDPSENDHSYDFAFYGEGGCEAPRVIPTANAPCTGQNLNLMAAVSGGQMPYTFSWTGPDGFTSSLQNPTITSVDSTTHAGDYNLTVTDALGCEETICINVEINEVRLSLMETDANCGAGDGAIDLTIEGGQAPVMINWDNDGTMDPNDDPEDLTSLTGGPYVVMVIDGDGCQETENASINESGAPTISAVPTPASCGMANGSIDLMISGVAATNIDWDNDGVMGDSDPEDISGLAAGTYTVVVTGGGCDATLSVTIEDTPVPTSSFTQVNETCGDSNGSIDLTVSGGTPPYEYDWDGDMAFDDAEDLTGLGMGMYTVVVRDANGCTTTETVTITDTAGPTLSATPTNETCGSSNGSIDLEITDGTMPFTITWNNGLSTEDISGLGAGSYSVTVTDANGCEVMTSAMITNTDGPTLSATPTDATDCAEADGSIDLMINGGTGPYDIDWDYNGLGDTDDPEDPSGLAAGIYMVFVTDANGCMATVSALIGDASEPVLDIVVTDPTTCSETGSIDLTITGMNAPYSIDWSNDGLGDNDDMEDISGLEGGSYTVVVTGANGCTAQANTSIRIIRPPSLVETLTPPTCGNSDGEIDIVISDIDGMGPYMYDWDDDALDGMSNPTGLAAGNYTLTVTNGIGCEITETYNLSSDAGPELTLIPTNPNCEGSDGEIDMTITGGVGPYDIDWDNNGTGDTNDPEDLMGLSSGSYSVTVTDNMGCVAVGNLDLSSPPLPVLNAITSPETCMDANGGIDLMISGIGPFQIDWDNNGMGQTDDPEDLSGLSAGTYSVTVTDGNGCPVNTSVELTSVCSTVSLGSTVFEDGNNNGVQDSGDNGIDSVLVVAYMDGGDGMTDGVDDTPMVTGADGILGTADDAFGPDGVMGTADDGQPGMYTNTDGDYFFSGLLEGDYYVQIPATQFAMGANLEDSQISSNTVNGFAGETDPDDDVDNDDEGLQTGGAGTVTTSNIVTLEIAMEPVDSLTETAQGNMLDSLDDASGNMTLDFGFFAPVSLGDTTFVDLEPNGAQDPTDPPLVGATVTLYNAATDMIVTVDAEGGAITGTTTTDMMGFYEFTNLPPGDYYVVFDISTANGSDFYTFTMNDVGDDADDSDADQGTGQTPSTGDLTSGARFPDLDAGVVCSISVEAGDPQTICSTESVDLTAISAEIQPDSVAGFGGTWTTSGDGTFDNGGDFDTATSYTPGPNDVLAGTVTLTLTSDDPSMAPFNAVGCGPISDTVEITVLKVDCGSFFWDGDD